MSRDRAESHVHEAYAGKGELGSAVKDFKEYYCKGLFENAPRFIHEFAGQLFADLIAMEVKQNVGPKREDSLPMETKWK